MRSVVKIVTVIFLLLAGQPCALAQDTVRIMVVQDAASLRVSARGFYRISDALSGRVLSRGRNLKAVVGVSAKGLLLKGVSPFYPELVIRAEDPDMVSVDGRVFRGEVRMVKKGSRVTVVNYAGIEDYIKGILYNEVSHYWPPDALKAQSIVCRTYALYEASQNKAKDFDVKSDMYSQVYGGRSSERQRTNKAVDDTAGEVILYKGLLIPAYYHATCGGHTEDAAVLWNVDLPPLKGVPCGFCKDSPHYRWHAVIPLGRIAAKISAAGYACKTPQALNVSGYDPSGRARALDILCQSGKYSIPAKDFRQMLGPELIRSTNFQVDLADGEAVFEGLGWGHGVGLCQWGAYFMAKDGSDYRRILEYYYPGTQIAVL